MNFKIANSIGLIALEYDFNGYSECLTIGKEPALFLWDDCDDPGDENIVLFSITEENKNRINKALEGVDFNIDYTDRVEDLFQTLQPLLGLMQNGNYRLNFSENKAWYIYSKAAVCAEERLDKKEVEKEIRKYDKKLSQNLIYNYESYDAYRDTYCFNIYEYPFIAWKSEKEIDKELVKYYTDLILSGVRPFAVILKGKYGKDDYFHEYILDGHHKLSAYKNLKIEPLFAIIEFFPEEESEIKMDMERISQMLYPWQFNHYYDTWSAYRKRNYLQKNPDSLLKKHFKNGFITFLYPDGKKRAEAFFINDVMDGEYKYWYNNGDLCIVGNYALGTRINKWIYYFSTVKNTLPYVAKEGCIENEYIYKDGYPLVHKRWDKEGKINFIEYFKNEIIKFPLTEEMILKYSVEGYENIIKEREAKNKSEKEKQNIKLAKIKRDERVYEWLKLILIAVIFIFLYYIFL
ncbi:toxin-antitoxin system YwqK family antitoxin [Chryseobacterium jejuense]|uniref:Uncharacterized protein n=1 Tax=Chryseobacterium jejuense TaxID=445960 RepID=A0A2X2WWU5_CHRJE|nr:hypothetical protein [Chryseobacterium jejuense]SDJ33436.1 hypothetical protein SAMN05421542_3217 [Chryseobacterium jejuense]SQB45306.1 Uncharacterised protein [Chryseobacterium jejuense]